MLGNDKRQTCRQNLCGVCPVNQQRPLWFSLAWDKGSARAQVPGQTENLRTVLALVRETSPGYYGSDFKPGDLEHVYRVL